MDTYTVTWLGDYGAELPGGTYDTEDEARASAYAWARELADQGHDRSGIVIITLPDGRVVEAEMLRDILAR